MFAIGAGGVHPYGSFWLDFADKCIKGIAVLVAGAWTFFNHQRSRTYRRKLAPVLTGEFFQSGDLFYVHVQCEIKNVGQTVYRITQRGTGLEAVALRSTGREQLSVSSIFRAHNSIEPGESIVDPLVLHVPDPATYVALLLNLRIVSEGIEWNTSQLVRKTG